MRKGGCDSSSFSLFRIAIHSRISRETAAKAVIAMKMVFNIDSHSQFCGLTNSISALKLF